MWQNVSTFHACKMQILKETFHTTQIFILITWWAYAVLNVFNVLCLLVANLYFFRKWCRILWWFFCKTTKACCVFTCVFSFWSQTFSKVNFMLTQVQYVRIVLYLNCHKMFSRQLLSLFETKYTHLRKKEYCGRKHYHYYILFPESCHDNILMSVHVYKWICAQQCLISNSLKMKFGNSIYRNWNKDTADQNYR